jgi:hypothetical protein
MSSNHQNSQRSLLIQQLHKCQLLCKLCFRSHPSPWYTTKNCPFKDPTYILDKSTQERIMQHNSLYGKANKNYNKDMDLPKTSTTPPQATIPTTAKSTITPMSAPLSDITSTHQDSSPPHLFDHTDPPLPNESTPDGYLFSYNAYCQ